MPKKRIAVNTGAGFVPGMNAVLKGTALAAHELGWEVVGIRDGFAGLLYPDRYAEGGLLPLSPELVESLDLAGGGVLGQSAKVDPFHVRRVDEDGMVDEVDESDRIQQALTNRAPEPQECQQTGEQRNGGIQVRALNDLTVQTRFFAPTLCWRFGSLLI